jgi:hypothetical protein
LNDPFGCNGNGRPALLQEDAVITLVPGRAFGDVCIIFDNKLKSLLDVIWQVECSKC